MRVFVISDLHREHYVSQMTSRQMPWDPPADADVLALIGDIDNASHVADWLLGESKRLGKPILYTPGNHEFYGTVLEDSLSLMREKLRGSSVHLLDCDEVVIGGIRFLGATLWSDFRASLGPGVPDVNYAMQQISLRSHEYIHDLIHTRVDGRIRPFAPRDAARLHDRSAQWLRQKLAEETWPGKTVVMSHFGPGPESDREDRRQSLSAGAYWSDLRGLYSFADAWLFGHTHYCVDEVDKRFGLRLVSNPAGYPHERLMGFDPQKCVEL